MVTADEIARPQKMGLWLDVNGERLQDGTTANMVFSIKAIVAYVSRFFVLEPGDVIVTGTPAGVGQGMNPKRFLKAGDIVTLGADGLGRTAPRGGRLQARDVIASTMSSIIRAFERADFLMPKIDLAAVPERKGSGYPEPFAKPCSDRIRQRLGDAGGLADYGVNLMRLPPGGWSSQRHWHSQEDEFVYVLEGELVPRRGRGRDPRCAPAIAPRFRRTAATATI